MIKNLFIQVIFIPLLLTTSISKSDAAQEQQLVGAHPFFRMMIGKRFGLDVNRMDQLTRPKARDFIQPLTSKAGQEPESDSDDPYFPFTPERGYIDIYDKNNSMWYWHFRAKENPDNAPLMIWLTGGPGGASTFEVFYSNGPYSFHD